MIRTVWLAIVCLVLVSALAAGQALRMPADSPVAELAADGTTVGIDQVDDALGKADRLAINYVRREIPAQPVIPLVEPAAPVVTSPKPTIETKIISRHWRDPNAFSSSRRNSRQTDSRNKTSKTVDRKRDQAAERSKPEEPVKPCNRLGTIGDLLRSVNLSPACAS